MVIAGIMDFVVTTMVKKAVDKVVSLLVPGGAFIQAIISSTTPSWSSFRS